MSTTLSDEEKQLLEQRYEDLGFVEEIDEELKCGRCQQLTIHHYFSQCGHVFCANCRRLLTDNHCQCPRCKTPIVHMMEQKVEFEQRIYMVKVTCPNKKYGCSVATTLLLLPEHLRQCKDTQEASLPAELILNEVTKSMLNRFEEMGKLMNHVVNKVDQLEQKVNRIDQLERKIDNMDQLEQKVNKMDQLEQKVNKIDQLEQKVNRINQLEEKVSRLDIVEMSSKNLKEEIQQMKTKISEQPIDKFMDQMREMKNEMWNLRNKVEGQEESVGKSNQFIINMSLELRVIEAQAKKQKKSLKKTFEQLNDKMRKLELEMDQTKQLNSSVDKLKAEMEQNNELQMKKWNKYEESPKDCDDDAVYNFFYCHKYEPMVLRSVVYRWILKDITQLTKKKIFEYKSKAFPLPGYPFAAKAKIMLKEDDNVYFDICFKNSSGHMLQPNDVIPQFTCVLRDVRNKQQMKHRIQTSSYLFTHTLQYNTYYFNNIKTRKSWLTDSEYNADDSVEILFLVEPPSVAFQLMSTDGSIIQCISHYQHRLQLAQERYYEYHCSPYFSTKHYGYRVWVRMWLDGYRNFEGKGLTAEISFLCGEYDSQLSKSFKHTTTVTLMNQRDLSNHLIRSAEEDINVKNDYYINVATHKEIQDGGYIINDSLIYQINIQPN